MHLDPVRLAALAACLSFAGCDSGGKDDTGPSGDTGPEAEPNVPEGYEYWDTDGCDDGEASVYHLAAGRSEDGETLTAVDRWYWYFGHEDYIGDCMDEFVFEGVATHTNWGSSEPCSECEEEYTGTYVYNEENELACNIAYASILVDENNQDTEFQSVLMFDTLTPSGNPNEDDKMLVIALFAEEGAASWAWYPNWGRGHAVPDVEEDFGGPSTYDWVSAEVLCVRTSG